MKVKKENAINFTIIEVYENINYKKIKTIFILFLHSLH